MFDTETTELKEFYNTNCPLFRKIKVDTIEELKDYLGKAEPVWKYILHIDCAFEIKDEIESIIADNKSILNYKITTKSIKQEDGEQQEDIRIESNLDVKQSFKDFLNTGIELRYPMNLYNEVIGETQKEEKDVIKNDKFENLSSNSQTNTLF